MLGDSFVLPLSSGDVTLKKINQDGYSSEYLFRDNTHQFIVRIRHTKTAARNGRPSYDRHNLEAVETVFALGEEPEFERKFYFVAEQLPSDPDVELAEAVATKATATANALLVALMGWQS